ncbi:hypothetical protein [Spirosoma aerophilum]
MQSTKISTIANPIGPPRYAPEQIAAVAYSKQPLQLVGNLNMTEAYQSSQQPALQIENMFYDALEVGIQYSFVKKLFERNQYTDRSTALRIRWSG